MVKGVDAGVSSVGVTFCSVIYSLYALQQVNQPLWCSPFKTGIIIISPDRNVKTHCVNVRLNHMKLPRIKSFIKKNGNFVWFKLVHSKSSAQC